MEANAIHSLLTQLRVTAGDAAIVAQQHYKVKAVKCDMPALILPLHGTKRLHAEGQSWTCRPGEYVMLHQALSAEVENIPADDGPYRAWIIAFPWRLLELARQLIAERSVTGMMEARTSVSHGVPSAALIQALGRYNEAIGNTNDISSAAIDVSLLGILVALHSSADSAFLFASDPALSARIRILVSSNPIREWCSADFEDAFHISGATLRRRLSAEDTSLRMVIRQARLHAALGALQTSSKPIKAIAMECGYRSLASFRENFFEQFGVEPAVIAHT